MIPSLLLLAHQYSPSNDSSKKENIKSLTKCSSPFLVHIGTPLPQEVDISVSLELNQDGLLLLVHLLHLTVKEELTGLYSVVVLVVTS